jgi:hypothetical protein
MGHLSLRLGLVDLDNVLTDLAFHFWQIILWRHRILFLEVRLIIVWMLFVDCDILLVIVCKMLGVFLSLLFRVSFLNDGLFTSIKLSIIFLVNLFLQRFQLFRNEFYFVCNSAFLFLLVRFCVSYRGICVTDLTENCLLRNQFTVEIALLS